MRAATGRKKKRERRRPRAKGIAGRSRLSRCLRSNPVPGCPGDWRLAGGAAKKKEETDSQSPETASNAPPHFLMQTGKSIGVYYRLQQRRGTGCGKPHPVGRAVV